MSNYLIHNDDCLKVLDKMSPNTIDCIITDPPYELNFMCKGWDNAGVSFDKTTWYKCLKVLKPGGYLVSFGGTRTYHRIACAIEDAGFEIRDCVMWLYGSGFPKSMDIEKAINKRDGVEFEGKPAKNWKGWGTALKPSYEPIIVARKPFKGSLVDNVMKYGVGGLNIDECRIGNETIKGGTMPDFRDIGQKSKEVIGIDKLSFGQVENAKRKPLEDHVGRFPANTILDTGEGEKWRRYFYCAKASRKDRDDGLLTKNTHPTVKPTVLMQYLIRLVAPKGATILDPFVGSGSTGKAVMCENKERNAGYKFIGIEKDGEYCKIAEARIKQVGGCNE